jgi:hypothetical protein
MESRPKHWTGATLNKDIKNINGVKMGVNVQFGFAVPRSK